MVKIKKEKDIYYYIYNINISLIFIFYTIYSFTFAYNKDHVSNTLLLILSLLALINFCTFKRKISITSELKLTSTFLVALILITLTTSNYSHFNFDLALIIICKIFLCFFIIFNFNNKFLNYNDIFEKLIVSLCILLAIIMIIQNNILNIKGILKFYLVNVVDTQWNEKYHSFWLIFLTWTTLFKVGFVGVRSKILSFIIIIYSCIATKTSYSESAYLAMICSLLSYIVCLYSAKLVWYSLVIFISIFLLIFPFFWQIFPSYMWEWVPINHFDRILLFETSSKAIMDKFLLGHGFGSTFTLNISEYITQDLSNFKDIDFRIYCSSWISNIEILHNGLFPGKHPHNIVALIWLEFGILGIIFCLYIFYKFHNFFIHRLNNINTAPYVIALCVAGFVLFSFSFSVWNTDIILTYAMFICCLKITIHEYEQNNSQ